MRDTPRGIVEELRAAAQMDAVVIGVEVAEIPGSEAADYIEYLRAALARIEAGEPDPVGIARAALDPMRWMLSATAPG